MVNSGDPHNTGHGGGDGVHGSDTNPWVDDSMLGAGDDGGTPTGPGATMGPNDILMGKPPGPYGPGMSYELEGKLEAAWWAQNGEAMMRYVDARRAGVTDIKQLSGLATWEPFPFVTSDAAGNGPVAYATPEYLALHPELMPPGGIQGAPGTPGGVPYGGPYAHLNKPGLPVTPPQGGGHAGDGGHANADSHGDPHDSQTGSAQNDLNEDIPGAGGDRGGSRLGADKNDQTGPFVKRKKGIPIPEDPAGTLGATDPLNPQGRRGFGNDVTNPFGGIVSPDDRT